MDLNKKIYLEENGILKYTVPGYELLNSNQRLIAIDDKIDFNLITDKYTANGFKEYLKVPLSELIVNKWVQIVLSADVAIEPANITTTYRHYTLGEFTAQLIIDIQFRKRFLGSIN